MDHPRRVVSLSALNKTKFHMVIETIVGLLINLVVCSVSIIIFVTFGFKVPTHTPNIVFWGRYDPLNVEQYQQNAKTAHPRMSLHNLSHQVSKSIDW